MQTTLAHMIGLLEHPLQETVARNRDYLVDSANRVRQLFYNLYKEFELEVDVTDCFEVQEFTDNACVTCDGSYLGVTLPAHMQTVEAVWSHRGTPFDLYSKWRETKTGIKPKMDCALATYDRPGTFPTERDLNKQSALSVQAVNPADAGKQVEIVYRDIGGETKREALVLQQVGGTATTNIAVGIMSVVLPQLLGPVRLTQACDGRLLSEYLPGELVPSYKRIKVTGVSACDQILVRASRQFTPVYWDTDIVETDNQEAIINAGLYIFYSGSGPEGQMLQKAEYHYSKMRDALHGEAARQLGLNRENTTGRFGPPIRRSRLSRGRMGHNIIQK